MTITATDPTGASGSASFTWTITGSTGGGFPGGYHRLVIAKNSLCLDVYGDTGTAGAAIDQWTCKNAPGTNQDFTPR